MNSSIIVDEKENLFFLKGEKQIHAKKDVYVRSFKQISSVLKVAVSGINEKRNIYSNLKLIRKVKILACHDIYKCCRP